MILIRIISNIILVLSILLMPWWFSLLLAVILFFLFNNFVEIIIAGLLIDIIYGVPQVTFLNFSFIGGLGGLIIYLLGIYFKKGLKFYH